MKEINSQIWVAGIMKGPGKPGLCCLIIARELPRGTHLPWVPTLCTDKLYKMWGGKVRVNPTWVKTLGFHQTAQQIYKFGCENRTANLEIYQRKWKLECKTTKTQQKRKRQHKLKQNKTKIYKESESGLHINLLRYWTGIECINDKLTNNTSN